ncbi:hypothetical protein MRX96_034886 [Rhipicephalus microplus]
MNVWSPSTPELPRGPGDTKFHGQRAFFWTFTTTFIWATRVKRFRPTGVPTKLGRVRCSWTLYGGPHKKDLIMEMDETASDNAPDGHDDRDAVTKTYLKLRQMPTAGLKLRDGRNIVKLAATTNHPCSARPKCAAAKESL